MREAQEPTRSCLTGHVLDWLPMLVCHVEADGKISYLNRSWKHFSGLTSGSEPRMWTELLAPEETRVCHGPSPASYSAQKNVLLLHAGSHPVMTDLHWQKMGATEGGGWILYCHPELDFPLFANGSDVTWQSRQAVHDLPIRSMPSSLRATEHLREDRLAVVQAVDIPGAPGPTSCAAVEEEGDENQPLSLARLASYTARRAFHALGRELAARRETGERFDRLTGLCNRDGFEIRLEQALVDAVPAGRSIGFLLADIDYLGDLNNLYGRDVGDQVLKFVAGRLRLVTDQDDDAARTGDDEFSAVITGEVTASVLAEKAQSLLSFIDTPFRIGNRQIRFGVSVGAALYPRDGNGIVRLRHAAQLALNDVKAHGRGGYRLFHQSMARRSEGVTAQTNVVRQMLDQDLVYPAYQAKVRLRDGQITGAEALMRWHRRNETESGPDAFPEIFRNYDLASRVSARVQERVFEDIGLWIRAGLMPPPISINVAPVEFMQDDYAEKLLSRLDSHGLSARLIELELTEHVLYQNSEHYIHRALTLLRRAGVRVTLDDFGTGYSSLGFLRDFPVSSIKIDRSFIRKICSESSMEVIVEAIIRFGEAVSVDVVAEGIETEAQLALLRRIGCPTGQGFLFSPPVESTGFARLLAGSRRFDL